MQYVLPVKTCLKSFRHTFVAHYVGGGCVYWEGHNGACGYYLCEWTSYGKGRGWSV